ncbi:pIX [Bovine adenovirus 3]|uniref:Hexon-interlacing protein IX n=1 Tax=Bovine adenovirus B serotype 3 TaxID=10510 RepID=CAP9_ADEB3|nr:pIX [Bovine adenovirus 3]AP_000024.1 IX [Bovine mastadenovirus B]3ZIF_N Chain N, Pix [Bovine adenovirus 3]3ZIF_O Chain O, Pix [Bovine adenovirus 3]3ZIF_P Chain P, Pix [Bovine adenovirus 3]3ZIF_Q Chain Q, Pix [Bovine adenovirus 3]AAD09717.1 pIX [Bovine adenovirus 3]BAA04819.1 protein IX [Bovine adenovirus 3]
MAEEGRIYVPYVTARLPKWSGSVQDKTGSNMLGGVVLPPNSQAHRTETVGTEATRDNLHAEGARRPEDQTPYMILVEDSLGGLKRRMDLLEESNQQLLATLNRLRTGLAAYVQANLVGGQVNPFV